MFNVQILQSTLMMVLNYLEPIVGKNTTNMGDDCICMDSTNVGTCKFFVSNMIEFAQLEAICANSTTPDKAPYVNFKRLKGIISTIPANEYITLADSGSNELLISWAMKKTPIKLAGNSNGMISAPAVFYKEPAIMNDLPFEFLKNASTKASNIIQESVSNTLMNCIKLSINNPDVTVEAIDVNSKRTFFMSQKIGNPITPQVYHLEAGKLSKALKMFEDYPDIELGEDNNVTLIKSSSPKPSSCKTIDIVDTMYATRNLSGNFPVVSQYYSSTYLPMEYITVNKTELLSSIARFKAVMDNSTTVPPTISIKVDKGEFNFNYASSYGEIDDMVDTDNSITTPFNANFNYKNFEEVIKSIDSDFIDIGIMQKTQSNFIVKGSNTGNNVYIGGDMYSILSTNIPVKQTP
jgi:hypothetical protein